MASTKVTASAEPPRKGIQKVNLNDLQGQLNKRGRERFQDPELAEAFVEMLKDNGAFIWATAVPTGNDDKSLTSSKMKWRSRAVSVFNGLPESVRGTKTITIAWTKDDRMVISPKAKA